MLLETSHNEERHPSSDVLPPLPRSVRVKCWGKHKKFEYRQSLALNFCFIMESDTFQGGLMERLERVNGNHYREPNLPLRISNFHLNLAPDGTSRAGRFLSKQNLTRGESPTKVKGSFIRILP